MRERRRLDTLRSIEQQALLLTRDHGLDGWTMDELAKAVGVSRRTLFNHVPGKIDAVLGDRPQAAPERMAQFLAGGPTGELFSDLGALARSALDDRHFERDTIALRREVLLANPRLAVTIHERFEEISRELVDCIVEREGDRISVSRARLLVRLIVAVVDSCLLTLLEDFTAEQEPARLSELFDQNLHDARHLLAPKTTTPQEP